MPLDAATLARCETTLVDLLLVAGRVSGLLARDPPYRASAAKADGSPITAADVAIQIVLLDHLARANVPQRVIAEESDASLRGADPGAWGLVERAVRHELKSELHGRDVRELVNTLASEKDGPYWSIDPIDGTSGWVAGRTFCTCIALIDQGQAILGGVVMPRVPDDWTTDARIRDGLMLRATFGQGAFASNGTGWSRLHRTPLTNPPVWLCSARKGNRTERGRRVLERAAPNNIPFPIDSQCKYALVAQSIGDIAFRLSMPGSSAEQAWDHAAGLLLVSESGGMASDIRGQSIHYADDGRMSNSLGAIGCAAELHRPIIDSLAALGMT
ncbi:MAG: hypothetical protein O2800_04850 [Planctomycetota bacterium]|nr:hypothetical protein [Planctomycetota bacterium]